MDDYIGYPGNGFGILNGIGHAVTAVIGALFILVVVVVVAGLVVLLVRYLLVATKAAQLYVDRNAPKPPAPGPSGSAPAGPAPADGSPREPDPSPAATVPAAKPAGRTETTVAGTEAPAPAKSTKPRSPRTPKSPPAS